MVYLYLFKLLSLVWVLLFYKGKSIWDVRGKNMKFGNYFMGEVMEGSKVLFFGEEMEDIKIVMFNIE